MSSKETGVKLYGAKSKYNSFVDEVQHVIITWR